MKLIYFCCLLVFYSKAFAEWRQITKDDEKLDYGDLSQYEDSYVKIIVQKICRMSYLLFSPICYFI